MPERPLLKLPDPVPFEPKPGQRGGTDIARPQRDRQRERLGPRFARLMEAAGTAEGLLSLQSDPSSIAPERAIVFEVAGQLADFYAQARQLGLEYLGDYEENIEPSNDFFDKKKPEKEIGARIYLAMPDDQALRELLSLWRHYQSGQKMPRGRGPWRELFSLLVDIRPWGPQDRVPPETISYWRSMLDANQDAPVRFEVELWFYENAERRERAWQRTEKEIDTLGGQVIHHVTIPEIRYHAALVDVPANRVQ